MTVLMTETNEKNELSKLIFDPIHKYMTISPICIQIIDTPIFKRLKHLKQLGLCCEVFPGATHTRFEHSIGVSYLAGKLIRTLQKNQPELTITDEDIQLLEIAGLCHDLGHGPFSHLWDNNIIPALSSITNHPLHEHEARSCHLFKQLVTEYNIPLTPIQIQQVQRYIVPGPKDTGFLYQIVANHLNGIDVDKFDYLCRDTYNIGVEYSYDYSRVIRQARVIDDIICYPTTVIRDLYQMYYIRYKLHKEIYNHPVIQSIEFMIQDIISITNCVFQYELITEDCSDSFVSLTDSILDRISQLSLTTSNSVVLSQAQLLLHRIHVREIYKCLGEVSIPWQPNASEIMKSLREKCFDYITTKFPTRHVLMSQLITRILDVSFQSSSHNPLHFIYMYSSHTQDKAVKTSVKSVQNYLPNEMKRIMGRGLKTYI